jgi:hypothetical protein
VALIKNVPLLKRKFGDSPDETAFFRWAIKKKLHYFGFMDVSVKPFDFMHPKIPSVFLNSAEKLTVIMERIPLLKEIAGSLLIQGRKIS